MKQLLLFFFSFIFFSNQVNGQSSSHSDKVISKAFTLGKTDEIRSAVLSETRILNIYLPQGYSADSATTYPVIYLLDGSANEDFIHVSGLVQFFNLTEMMPKSIVVGIANVDRKRDFTFPTTVAKDKEDFPTTGKSANFINFLSKEVQPYIEKNYKTSASKTLIGQSLGGLLATEILFKEPGLFNNYLIISPSLWWDNESLLTKSSGLSKSFPAKKVKVYVAVGKEGKIMEEDAKKLSEVLKDLNHAQLKVDFAFFPEATHADVLHMALYKGFQLLNQKN